MGNDGGSIPKRRELVKEAARLPSASELKATALESLAHAWDTCPLSSEPLDPAGGTAVVSDWRGRLYSYESVLQCLASTSSSSSSSSETPSASIPETQQAEFARTGIRGLKDVVKLRFAVRRDERGRGFRACPVSMKELGAGSNARAVYVVPCGHVFAEVAIRETIGTTATATNSDNNRGKGETETNGEEEAEKQKQKQCPECSEPFQERDLIPILSTDEAELERLARRADELKALGLTHSLKKDKSGGGGGSGGKSKNKKKRKAGGEDANDENGAKAHNAKEKKDDKNNSSSKSSSDKNGISSRINNSATASLTAKVLAEQEERNKRRKMVARSEAVR